MNLLEVNSKVVIYNQMLKKRERKEHPVYVQLEEDHVRFSIENGQDHFKFFRDGNIEDLHIHIPIGAIKELNAEILEQEQT